MESAPVKHRAEVLDYIRAMLGQLRSMAEADNRDMLAFLIEMAYLEASDMLAAESSGVGKDERDSAA